MATSNISALINCDLHKVWDTVYAVEKYSLPTVQIQTSMLKKYELLGVALAAPLVLCFKVNKVEINANNKNIMSRKM